MSALTVHTRVIEDEPDHGQGLSAALEKISAVSQLSLDFEAAQPDRGEGKSWLELLIPTGSEEDQTRRSSNATGQCFNRRSTGKA